MTFCFLLLYYIHLCKAADHLICHITWLSSKYNNIWVLLPHLCDPSKPKQNPSTSIIKPYCALCFLTFLGRPFSCTEWTFQCNLCIYLIMHWVSKAHIFVKGIWFNLKKYCFYVLAQIVKKTYGKAKIFINTPTVVAGAALQKSIVNGWINKELFKIAPFYMIIRPAL